MVTIATATLSRAVRRGARLYAVELVRQHLRLPNYFQLTRQLYRQPKVYFAQRSWDNACVSCTLDICIRGGTLASAH